MSHPEPEAPPLPEAEPEARSERAALGRPASVEVPLQSRRSRPNRARRVLLGAVVIGFFLIFGSVLSQQLGLSKLEKGCAGDDPVSCFNLCVKRPELPGPCERVKQMCSKGDAYACGAVRYLERRPPRARW